MGRRRRLNPPQLGPDRRSAYNVSAEPERLLTICWFELVAEGAAEDEDEVVAAGAGPGAGPYP